MARHHHLLTWNFVSGVGLLWAGGEQVLDSEDRSASFLYAWGI